MASTSTGRAVAPLLSGCRAGRCIPLRVSLHAARGAGGNNSKAKGELVHFTPTRVVFVALLIVVAALVAAGLAGISGILHRMDGASVPAACLRAGAAFAAVMTLAMALLTLLSAWLL
ncbi:hypothetical protein [Streptomyces sp. NBC_00046]|uniref:hypothetical protein n=1 Tax=unclassified Streptomyces TaxID=2593676 RepID=UPI0032555C72